MQGKGIINQAGDNKRKCLTHWVLLTVYMAAMQKVVSFPEGRRGEKVQLRVYQ